jgi:eukaryotic-like serine/threonine-protein kinase
MRPLAFLRCVARGVLRYAADAAGFGLGGLVVEVVQDVWKEWNRERPEGQCKADLETLLQMEDEEFRRQVDAVVREVAAGEPPEVGRRLSVCLQEVRQRVRDSFRRPDDPQGRSIPPGFRLRQASDLAALLSLPPGGQFSSLLPAGSEVTLHFTSGGRAGESLTCTEPTVLLLGRAKDCNPRFSRDGHKRLSRHHCLVEINPPDVRVRDLGSLHGTFVNDNLIGRRPKGKAPAAEFASAEHDLADGDEVRLATPVQVAFRVSVHVPAQCSGCGASLAGEQKAGGIHEEGGHLCPVCRQSGQEVGRVKLCAWCGREVAAERGANRPGQFVCGECRDNMQATLQTMFARGRAGHPGLEAIRDYILVDPKPLGQGGMGAVYLARHERTGEPAAIKVLLPRVAADERAVRMFEREIRNTMALRHRHVVRLLDQGFARGAFFMALEYCDGGSVEDLLAQRGGRLPVDEAVEITLQALEGLEYAHEADIPFVRQKDGGYAPGKGLVHRDLKPANLFLTGWGSGRVVKVGDYGLAKALDETGLSGGTRTGDVAGTPQLMCRQQVVYYKESQPEVDVWAMAATLYYLLTGSTPRDFPAGRDPWLVVLEDNPVPILQRNPKLPPRLARVIDHALAEDPEMPFRTAAALRTALEEAL